MKGISGRGVRKAENKRINIFSSTSFNIVITNDFNYEPLLLIATNYFNYEIIYPESEMERLW